MANQPLLEDDYYLSSEEEEQQEEDDDDDDVEEEEDQRLQPGVAGSEAGSENLGSEVAAAPGMRSGYAAALDSLHDGAAQELSVVQDKVEEQLLRLNFPPDLAPPPAPPSERWVRPLGLAAASGHVDCVLLLLDAGAAVDGTDGRSATALMVAAANGHLACVRALIDSGAPALLLLVLGLAHDGAAAAHTRPASGEQVQI